MTLKIIEIKESVGGELGEEVSELIGKSFKCHCDRKIILGTQDNFEGYRHNGGLADGKGVTWWLFVECPNCEYRWSWLKIKGMMARQTNMEEEIDGYDI